MFRVAPLFVFLMALLPSAASPEGNRLVLRYTILGNNTPAGREVDTYSAEGTVDSNYEFNDRGRGPKIEAHYQVSLNGRPLQTDITGHDYLKAPVDEHFRVENHGARWKSTAEQGEAAKPDGFYVSINGPAAESALLVSALLKAKGGSMPLFPGGEGRVEKVTETTLESHGQKMHVTDYGVTGLSFEPQTVWVDDDLHFFAAPGKFFAIMREGWESFNQQLFDLDQKSQDARYARLARELAHRPAHAVAIEHVRLYDSELAATREDQTVVFSGERITAVGPSTSVPVPTGAERIDGKGRTLVPGLFDMHTHMQPIDGLLNIASGITGVRDLGNDIDLVGHLQEQWQSGTAIGPRMWKAGFIDGRGPFQAPTGLYADTLDEARAAVKRYADSGYMQIKLYSSLKPEYVAGIAQAAHERGMRVSGHVPNGMIASQFVEAGADEIQHINFIFLNFLAEKVKDTRTPERFTAVGEYAAKLDLQSEPVNEFIELLRSRGTAVDVTLVIFESMFTARLGQVSASSAPVIQRLPAQLQRAAYTGGLPVTAENDQRYKDAFTAMLRMTKRMYDAGIPILAGTDIFDGFALHRELELEVMAGIPAAKALQIATLNAARVLKQEKELGSIAPGKLADMVLVEGNPAVQISDIRRCRLVVKNGQLFESNALYAAAGIKPAE